MIVSLKSKMHLITFKISFKCIFMSILCVPVMRTVRVPVEGDAYRARAWWCPRGPEASSHLEVELQVLGSHCCGHWEPSPGHLRGTMCALDSLAISPVLI